MDKKTNFSYNFKPLYILSFILIGLFIYASTCNAVLSEKAEFKIERPKIFGKNIYPLNFLGSKATIDDTTITAQIIKSEPDKNLYVINKGSNDNIRKGLEFAIVENNIRVANLVVIEVKPDIAALKLNQSFPELCIGKNDIVYSYLPYSTGFLPSYIEDPKLLALKELRLIDLFRIAIQNSTQVYEAKRRLEEAWHEYKYAQARFYPHLWAGISWDTVYRFKDLLSLTWLIEPSRNKIVTRKNLNLYKFKYILEEEKFIACLNALDKYADYHKTKEQIRLQKEIIRKLKQEREIITAQRTVSSSIIEKLSSLIKYHQLKLNNLMLQEKRDMDILAISLGYPSGTVLRFKKDYITDTMKIYDALNSLVFIPREGFNLKLSQIDKKISLIDYHVAKKQLYPVTQLTVGIPSLIGFAMPKFTLTGKALKESAKFLYQRQRLITKDIAFQREHNIAKNQINITYLNKLKDNIKIITSLSDMAMDSAMDIEEISNSRANHIKAIELEHETKWEIFDNEISLILSGTKPSQWQDRIPVKKGLPDLQPAINHALENSYILEATKLYKEAIHPFLIDAKQKGHKKTPYYEVLLGEREALIDITKDEKKIEIIKNWINVTIKDTNLKNSEELVGLAKEKLNFYKEKQESAEYDVEDATINLAFTQIDKQKAELSFILSLLDFKKSTYYNVDEEISLVLKKIPYPPDYKLIERELTETVVFHPEAKIKEMTMLLKQGIESVELAKKGWWVGGPITIRYAKGLPGGRTIDTSRGRIHSTKWHDGLDISDWLGIQFPISIFERTPLGERIHNVRRAKIQMEIQKFSNELEQERLKMEWQTANQNLKLSKAVLEQNQENIANAREEIQEIQEKIQFLQADKLDLISQKKLYVLRKKRYTEYLENYLDNFIDLLSMGHIFEPKYAPPERKDLVLLEEKHEYPVLTLIELQSQEIEEAFRQSLRQNISSWFFSRIRGIDAATRTGIGSSISFSTDFTKAEAQMRVEQMKFHRAREVFEADTQFAELHSTLQIINFSKQRLEEKKKDLIKILEYLQEEVEISIGTKQQVNELKDIMDKIDMRLINYRQSHGSYSDRIRQLLGVPYYAELSLPKTLDFDSIKKIEIKDPESLILSSLYTDPELLLRVSEVELAQKEQRYTRGYRDLTFSIGGEWGTGRTTTLEGDEVKKSRRKGILGLNLGFALFDLTLKPEQDIIKEKENRFKMQVASQVMDIRNRIYDLYSANLYYLSLLKNQAEILKATSNDFRESLELYKQHRIRWDGEYGLKPTIIRKIQEYSTYLEYLELYQKNFSILLEFIKQYAEDPGIFSIRGLDFDITKHKLETDNLKKKFSFLIQLQ